METHSLQIYISQNCFLNYKVESDFSARVWVKMDEQISSLKLQT